MPNTIQIRRGASISLPVLDSGEFGFTTDEYGVFIGDGTENHELLKVEDVDTYLPRSFVNGSFVESFNALASSSDGINVGIELEQVGGGDLTMQLSDGNTVFDTTPVGTIALTPGTLAAPQDNYIYIPQSTKVLTKSLTSWPMDVEHIKIGYFYVPDASTVQSDGVFVNQNWNDHLYGTNMQGHMLHMAARSRAMGAIYNKGVDPAGVTNYITSTTGSVTIQCSSGLILQMHPHNYTAKDTLASGDDIHVVNDYTQINYETPNLYTVTTDASGGTLTNKFFTFVLWGVANKTGEYSPLMVNMPSGTYNNIADAEADPSGYIQKKIPAAYIRQSSTGFLIAAITVRQQSGTWVFQSWVDLRGDPAASIQGGSAIVPPTALTDFPDDIFRIHDNINDTRKIAFTLDNLATDGITRTYYTPDVTGEMAIWTDVTGGQTLMSNNGATGIVTVLDSGYIGINETNPLAQLHINGGVGSLATGLAFGAGTSGVYEVTSNNLAIATASADRLSILSTGVIQINTTPTDAGATDAILRRDATGNITQSTVDDLIGDISYWTRDAVNGYLYPSTLTDIISIGSNSYSAGYIFNVYGNSVFNGYMVVNDSTWGVNIQDNTPITMGTGADYSMGTDGTKAYWNVGTSLGVASGITMDILGDVAIGSTDAQGYKLYVSGTTRITGLTTIDTFGTSAGNFITHSGNVLQERTASQVIDDLGLEDLYVNVTGDTMTGRLNLPNAGFRVSGWGAWGETYSAASQVLGQGIYVDPTDTVSRQIRYLKTHASSGHSFVEFYYGAIYFYNVNEASTAGDIVTRVSTLTIASGGAVSFASTAITAGGNTIWHAGNSNLSTVDWAAKISTASNFISNVATGTQPYACTSETLNEHLNADLLDGHHWSEVVGENYWTLNGTDLYYTGGNVGIGTSSPQSQLHVKGTSILHEGQSIILTELNYPTARLHKITHGHSGGVDVNNFIALEVSTAAGVTNEVLRLDGAGNVGINTNVPLSKLHIEGDFNTDVIIKVRGHGTGRGLYHALSTGTGEAGMYFDAIDGDISGGDYGFIGQHDNGDVVLISQGSNSIKFKHASNTRYEIDGSGNHNFQVGTATFGNDLNITTTGSANLYMNAGTNANFTLDRFSVSYDARIRLRTNAVVKFDIGLADDGDENFYIGNENFANKWFSISQSTGSITISDLAGTGDRMVVANASGILSTQSITTGTVTGTGVDNEIAVWNGTSSLDSDANFTWDNTSLLVGTALTYSRLQNSQVAVFLSSAGNTYYTNASPTSILINSEISSVTKQLQIGTDYITSSGIGNILTINGNSGLTLTSPVTVSELTGLGDQMVIASSSGLLGVQAIPTQSSINYWTKNGTDLYYTDGLVGIGTSTPTDLLTVINTIVANQAIISVTNNGGTGGASFKMSDITTSNSWQFKATTANTFKIRDLQWSKDIFVIENNSTANALYIKADGNILLGGYAGSGIQMMTVDNTGLITLDDVLTEITINNNVNNNIVTASGTANTINGESYFTFNDSTTELYIESTSATYNSRITFDRNPSANILHNDILGDLLFKGDDTTSRLFGYIRTRYYTAAETPSSVDGGVITIATQDDSAEIRHGFTVYPDGTTLLGQLPAEMDFWMPADGITGFDVNPTNWVEGTTAINGNLYINNIKASSVDEMVTIDSDGLLKSITIPSGGYTNLTSFVDQTAWRLFYSNGNGDVTELALGSNGTYLKSNGASSAPTFGIPTGSGNVTKVGTPVNNQVAIWTGDGTIEGDTDLTFNGSDLTCTGDMIAADFSATSDIRLKTQITDYNITELQTNYKSFRLISDIEESRVGVIAQELLSIHPEFVRENNGYYSVSYHDLHSAEIAYLKNEVKLLREELIKLKN